MSAINTSSIRQLIITATLNGLNTREIGALLQQHFPNSQAAAKVSKHVAFYRAELVKAGKIAKGTGAMNGNSATPLTVEQIDAQIQRLTALRQQQVQ